MEKRYQVFVSSTYADLQNERQAVIRALLEMDCIPAGMELFPAADEEQLEFIKRIIDDCDYYLLIIGGRYGSTTSDGISYTEKEYDYAVEKGMRVVALLHENPASLGQRTDVDPKAQEKLIAFREKVATGRLVKLWKTPEEIPVLVTTSLLKTMRARPEVGWIRANQVPNAQVLNEINELRKENAALQKELSILRDPPAGPGRIENLASLDSRFVISGTHYFNDRRRDWIYETTWKEIFRVIGPYLLQHPSDGYVRGVLAKHFFERAGAPGKLPYDLRDETFQTIKIQLIAQNLVSVSYLKSTKGEMALFWNLTDDGRRTLLEVATVRSDDPLEKKTSQRLSESLEPLRRT